MNLTSVLNGVLLEIMIKESGLSGQAVQKQIFDLGKELKAGGLDASDDEVQAAMLSAIVDANGDPNKVDVSDVESIEQQIKEGRSYVINEEAGLALHIVEGISLVLGSAAYIHAMCDSIKAVMNITIEESKLKNILNTIVKWTKKITGFPAMAIEKSFAWIAKKLGGSQHAQKIAGLSGTLLVVIFMLVMSVILFPSAGSLLLVLASGCALVGKSAEIKKLSAEILEHIEHMLSGGANTMAHT